MGECDGGELWAITAGERLRESLLDARRMRMSAGMPDQCEALSWVGRRGQVGYLGQLEHSSGSL